jgi:hypothetical protein
MVRSWPGGGLLLVVVVLVLFLPAVPTARGVGLGLVGPAPLGTSGAAGPCAIGAATDCKDPDAGTSGGSSSLAAPNESHAYSWSPLTSSPTGGRIGAGLAALSSDSDAVLFGGITSTGLSSSTQLYNESLDRWAPLSLSPSPSARSDFGFASDPTTGTAVLFGGLTDLAKDQVTNSTWVFSFHTPAWTNVTNPLAPAPREDAAFAVDPGARIALLFGGWDQNFTGTGQIVYSDTWELDLTTDVWTHLAFPGSPSPGPVHGASLVWYPTGNEFLLFGGCYPCSAAVWAFHAATSSWSSVATGGTAPGPRMNAVWTFDPVQRVVVVFGGTNGTGALNDTFLFAPSSSQWTAAYSPASPPARARTAADYLSAPGNETLLMTGGTTGNSTLSDTWRFSPVSNLTIRVANLTSGLPIPNALVRLGNSSHGLTNASGYLELTFVPATKITLNASAPGYAILVRSLWVPPAADLTIWLNLTPVPPGSVIVRVTTTTSQPIAGADANISIEGALVADPPLLTNAAGYANYTDVSPFTANVSGWYPGYHTQNTTVSIPSGRAIIVTLELVPQVRVHAYVLGDLADGNVTPLQTVLIRINGTIAGMTDVGGRLNATSDALGPVPVTASVYGFEPGNLTVTLPFTGSVDANFTLTAEPFPLLTVQVDDRVNGHGISDAYVNVTNVTPISTGLTHLVVLTNNTGGAGTTLPPGNYSITAWAIGFAQNSSAPVVQARPSHQIHLTIDLTPLPLATLDVLILDSATHRPIPGANVSINRTSNQTASSSGWTNFTQVPGGIYILTGKAAGYFTNSTVVVLQYGEVVPELVMNLTRVPPGPNPAGGPGAGLSLATNDPQTALPLLLLPIIVLLGAVIYLGLLRSPSSEKGTGGAAAPATPAGTPRPRRDL